MSTQPTMPSHVAPSSLATWRLFLKTHTLLIELIEQELAVAGLPPLAWYDVLFALAHATHHRLRMHELAKAMILDRSHLTRLVDRLEAKGLVCRKSCPTDRRGAFAAITEAGIAMEQQMAQVYQQAIAKYFTAHLSDTEMKILAKALQRMQNFAMQTQVSTASAIKMMKPD